MAWEGSCAGRGSGFSGSAGPGGAGGATFFKPLLSSVFFLYIFISKDPRLSKL